MTDESQKAVEQLVDAAKGSLFNVQTMIAQMPESADREGVNALQQWAQNLRVAISDAARAGFYGTPDQGEAA